MCNRSNRAAVQPDLPPTVRHSSADDRRLADWRAIIRGVRRSRCAKWSGSVLALSIAVPAALSGCTGSASAVATQSGQRAVELARHVPDCTNVRRTPAKTDGASTAATYVIDGHQVVFLAWKSAGAGAGPMTVALPSVEADGDTWNATVVNDVDAA